MPESKKRKGHHEHHDSANLDKVKKKGNIVAVGIIFFALLGLGIAFFAMGSDIKWLVIGAVAGGICGYFFGHQIDKSLSKK